MPTTDIQPVPRRRDTSGLPAETLVRRLSVRYLLVLLAVAILIAADQAVIQPLLSRMNAFAPAINLAGRQRMLSQKLAKAALALDAASAVSIQTAGRAELRDALHEWSLAHQALRYGAAGRQLPLIRTPAIDELWIELQPSFAAMHGATKVIIDPSTGEDERAAAAALIVAREGKFLAVMERIVKSMERQAESELWRLRTVAMLIAGAILALIIALGAFVLRPATKAIRLQVDQLELRVAQRTGELDAALRSLRQEVEQGAAVEQRSRALASQLAHADRVQSLGRLAAGLAHELNQPLGAIANYAAACEATLAGPCDERSAARVQRHLASLSEAALRAGAIVRRMRNYVRPGASSMAAVDLLSLLEDVAGLCRPEAARMEVEIELEPSAANAVVLADAIQIQQVLVNLIQNAIQAMATAPPQRRRLVLGMSTAGGGVQVDVRDSGSGLADADPELLFAPFQTTKPDGLGIGLSICRSIIQEHQGTIWAKSLPVHGAQFSFVLPLAVEHACQPA